MDGRTWGKKLAALLSVRFVFPQALAPRAQRVAVISSFNAWDPLAHQLTKTPEGDWRITVFLPPGRIVYCFSVDGVSWLDPCDEGRVANGWGSECSVRYVRDTRGVPLASSGRDAGPISLTPTSVDLRREQRRRMR